MALDWLPPPERALVVGINTYFAPSVPNLQGAEYDARAIYTLLTETLGMPADRIHFLTTEPGGTSPTRAAILEGLRLFLGGAPAGSELLFYYSGHGSFASLTPDIQFNDKRGETLVPADARVGGVLDILDRELRLIRAELAQKGLHLTVIADSCFSGDIMRGAPEPVDEMVPRMTASPHSGARSHATVLDGEFPLAALQALYNNEDELQYTLVSGCLPTEQSYEIPWQDKRRGVMTTALLQALHNAKAPITYSELGQLLPAYLTPAQREKQTPNSTGAVEQGIFGAPVPARDKPLFAVQSVTDGRVQLRTGLIHGLEMDSRLQAYSDWSLSTSAGGYTIVEVNAGSAYAVPDKDAPEPVVGQPLQLLYPSNRPTVYFDPSAKEIRASWTENKAVGLPRLIETQDAANADFVVTVEGQAFIARRKDGSVPAGLRYAQSDRRAPFEMAAALNRLACYEIFAALLPNDEVRWDLPDLNQPGGIRLNVETIDAQDNATALTPYAVGALAPNTQIRYTLANETGRHVWVALYLLNKVTRTAELVYPNDGNYLLESTRTPINRKLNENWRADPLILKLFVSSRELKAAEMPQYPCGTSEVLRGLYPTDIVTLNEEGWNSYTTTFGL